jgi:hypothetical protein
MIKKLITCCVFLLNGFCASSQVRSIMLDVQDRITVDSAEMVNYAVFGKITGDTVYTFKKFDFDGILLASGSFKDDSLKVPHGKFTYYNWITPENNMVNTGFDINGKERYVELTGVFLDGQRNGRWISFYSDGKMKQVITYHQGLAHGAYQFFNSDGKQQVAGMYIAGKKNGIWILKGGKQEDVYVRDQLISSLKGKKLRDQQATREQQAKSKNAN